MYISFFKSWRICSYFVGIVFLLSGMLKLLDPVGAALVIDDYFAFFNLGLLDFSSKALGWGLAMLETILGLALMAGVRNKLVAITTFSFLGFFTLLTGVLYLYNPQMDCGCFGEAIELTHLQTFLKNILLVLFSAIIFFPIKTWGEIKKRKYYLVAIGTVVAFVFGVYSLFYLPLIDFTDFKPSSELYNGQSKELSPEYNAEFIYEKDGVQEVFDLDNLPDSSWTYVDTKVVTSADEGDGGMPVLNLYNVRGEAADDVLHGKSVMVMNIYNLKSVSERKWEKIAMYMKSLSDIGLNPIIAVAANYDNLLLELNGLDISAELKEELLPRLFVGDYKSLITLNRSNGGLTYIDSSCIIRKWSFRSRPIGDDLLSLLGDDPMETYLEGFTMKNITFKSILIFIAILMLV